MLKDKNNKNFQQQFKKKKKYTAKARNSVFQKSLQLNELFKLKNVFSDFFQKIFEIL